MKKIIVTGIFYLFCCSFLFSQNRLRGIALDKNSGQPLPNIQISILEHGGSKARSTSNGEFILDLQNCKRCTIGNTISVFFESEQLGICRKEIIIKNSLTTTQYLTFESPLKVIEGIVSNSSGDFIEGVEFSYMPKESVAPSVGKFPTSKSDRFGRFSLQVDYRKVLPNEAIYIICIDPEGIYKDYQQLFLIGQPLKITLIEKPLRGSEEISLPSSKDIKLPAALKTFVLNYDNYVLEIGGMLLGPETVTVPIIDVRINDRGKLVIEYARNNGKMIGEIKGEFALEGEYSTSISFGKFSMKFSPTGSSIGYYQARNHLRSSGKFNIIHK